MAEKAAPDKFTYNPGAGSSAGGGGGGGGGDRDCAAAPSPAPRRDPSSPPRSPLPPAPFAYDPSAGSRGGGDGDPAPAPSPAPRPDPSSSTPRSPSPPAPFTYNPSAGSSGGGARAAPTLPARPLPPTSFAAEDYVDLDDDDEYNLQCGLELELGRRRGLGSLFMSDPQNLAQDICQYIGRQSCEVLSTLEFFSLRHNWQQLLDGKKTYLRPPSNNRAPERNYEDLLFKPPRPHQKTVQCQEPLSVLVRAGGATGKPIIQQKFKILSEHYVCFRPTRKDGSQFYRAFLFSYLENLGKMQSSQAEVNRLMECLARSRENFCLLRWDNAYFSNPEAFFSSVVSEFEHLVNSVANGLNADDLYKTCLQEITSSRILSLLRLLTEVHVRTNEAGYKSAFGPQGNALLFCIKYVRPFDTEAGPVQMRALSHALGIPLHLAFVDHTLKKINGNVQVKCLDFLPLSESGVRRSSGPLKSIRRYYLPSAIDEHPAQGREVMPAGNLFLSDHMPLVTLLSTNGNCAVLYRK